MSGIQEITMLSDVQDAKVLTGISPEKKKAKSGWTKWSKKHPERSRESRIKANKKSNEKHKEKYREHRKMYYDANKEKIRTKKKEYDKLHPEKRKEYKVKNKGKIALKNKEYRDKNKERIAAYNRKYWQTHPEKHRDNEHRRRSLKKGVKKESINSLEIYERDNWICGICHKKVNNRLKYPNPMSASLDHIIPLACGGNHTKNNVQLAHLQCNIKVHTGGIKQLLLPMEE